MPNPTEMLYGIQQFFKCYENRSTGRQPTIS